jgi:hypothetical protein
MVGPAREDPPVTIESPSDYFELRHAATDRATIVVVPERRMFAIDGIGSPGGADYRLASETLRTAAELLRGRVLKATGIETRIGVLECAWWVHPEPTPEELAAQFADRSSWHWQQMIEIPGVATEEEAAAAIDEARRRAGRAAPLLRVIRFREGQSAQILHAGGPATEAESVAKLFHAVQVAGLRPRGHLHELHLADPGRVPEGRARTILRLPIEPA